MGPHDRYRSCRFASNLFALGKAYRNRTVERERRRITARRRTSGSIVSTRTIQCVQSIIISASLAHPPAHSMRGIVPANALAPILATSPMRPKHEERCSRPRCPSKSLGALSPARVVVWPPARQRSSGCQPRLRGQGHPGDGPGYEHSATELHRVFQGFCATPPMIISFFVAWSTENISGHSRRSLSGRVRERGRQRESQRESWKKGGERRRRFRSYLPSETTRSPSPATDPPAGCSFRCARPSPPWSLPRARPREGRGRESERERRPGGRTVARDAAVRRRTSASSFALSLAGREVVRPRALPRSMPGLPLPLLSRNLRHRGFFGESRNRTLRPLTK